MITILSIDDDKNFLASLKCQLDELVVHSPFSDFTYEIISLHNSEKALAYCINNKVHIALLDIDMPGINGFDLATLLNKENEDAKIIFVSNLDNMVYRSLKFRPFRFLRKTHLQTELKEAIMAALEEIMIGDCHIVLSGKYFNKQVFLRDVFYVESQKNYVEVCTEKEKYMYRNTVSQLSEEWGAFDFFRVHAAFLVNLKKIKVVKADYIEMINGTEIKISRKYKTAFQEAYIKYLRK